MKRILTIALLAFAFSMSAQTKTDIPDTGATMMMANWNISVMPKLAFGINF